MPIPRSYTGKKVKKTLKNIKILTIYKKKNNSEISEAWAGIFNMISIKAI